VSDLPQGWRRRAKRWVARTDRDEQLSPRVAAPESTVASLAADVPRAEDAAERLAALERAVADHGRQLQVRAVMDWIERATLRSAPLVSVVLPTRDRRDFLPRAIESVQKQSYANWELLIVDDGSVDGTAEFLAGVAGDRVRCFRHHGAGACAARNVALTQARGDLIAYVDDDNMMHPAWLKAVVWGFEQRPEANVLYGGYVVDDAWRINRKRSGDLPRLFFLPYDHQAVARRSIADMGCIAHRAGLPEARFDESLREMGDWDLFLRLTRAAPPLALPAIACFYTTDAPNRLSHGPTFAADVAAVRAKNRR
jgi:glycosyltransferase involved in cell wall biosynthesis